MCSSHKCCLKVRALGFGKRKLFIVDNYLEAVGVMTALKAGVALSSVRRPLGGTVVCSECVGAEVDEDAAEAVSSPPQGSV